MKMKLWIQGILLTMVIVLLPIICLGESVNNSYFVDEDNAIGSIVPNNGILYVLQYDGIYMFQSDEDQCNLLTDEVSCRWDTDAVCVDTLLASYNGLLGVQVDSHTLLQISDSNNATDIKEIGKVSGDSFPFALFVQDNHFIWCEQDGDKTTVKLLDLASGKEKSITVKLRVQSMCNYETGYALAVAEFTEGTKKSLALYRIDLNTGDGLVITELDLKVRALAYNEKTKEILLACPNTLYRLASNGNPVLAAYTLGGDTVSVCALSSTTAAVLVDNSIAIRNLDGAGNQSTLTIQQPYGRSEEYKTFLMQHPEVNLVFCGSSNLSAEEQFIQDMSTKNSDVDIYLLSDPSLLTTIEDKGYYIDLAKSEMLQTTAGDMYAPYRELFCSNEGVIAIPQSIFVTMLGYRSDVFSEAGIDVPTTIEELLSLAELWYEEYAEDNENILFDPFQNGIDLTSILERYADESAANQEELRYSTDEMQSLLKHLSKVTSLYSNSATYGSYEVAAINLIDVPHVGIYQYMPLSITAEHTPVISGTDIDLSYFVVNPYSSNGDAALLFLESVAAGWKPTTKLIFLQSSAQAVERDGYLEEATKLQNEIDEIEASKETTGDNDRSLIEESLTKKKSALQNCQDTRWIVTQEEVDWYLSVVNQIYFAKSNPVQILIDSQPQLFAQYKGGTMDEKQFLNSLDQKVRSVNLEAQ